MGVQPGDVGTVGIVLAGGGARGAYEMGALSVLLEDLPAEVFERTVIVGTSVGAINAVLVASLLDAGPDVAAQHGLQLWRELDWPDVAAPLLSLRGVAPLLRYGGGVAGAGVRVHNLLDSRPLAKTLAQRLDTERLAANVLAGNPQAVAVVSTRTETARSVAFHDGVGDPDEDKARGIDYVRTPISVKHVLASGAVPAAFPPVWIADPPGWYVDGSVRLNTPIKPALKLGVDRLIVIAANTTRPAAVDRVGSPDIFDGIGQVAQAALGDPLANDIATLAKFNVLVSSGQLQDEQTKVVPYILIAPATRYRIGEIAQSVFRKNVAKLRTSPKVLGRLLQAGKSPSNGELFSYVFFAPEFFQALLEAGAADARAWLRDKSKHDAGDWQIGPLT